MPHCRMVGNDGLLFRAEQRGTGVIEHELNAGFTPIDVLPPGPAAAGIGKLEFGFGDGRWPHTFLAYEIANSLDS